MAAVIGLPSLLSLLGPTGNDLLAYSAVLGAPFLQRHKGDDVAAYPECFVMSKRIMEGLRSVQVVANSSIGHTQSMEPAIMLFRAAMNYRHDVFSQRQKQDV